MGHGTCTCEGAAFEYIVNLEFELRHRGVRDKAEITWITNEYELGDFGMGGMHLRAAATSPRAASSTRRCSPSAGSTGSPARTSARSSPTACCYETLDGAQREQGFDFAMLLPPFSGVGLRAFDREGVDITDRLFLPNEFMRVDADYTAKPHEQWKAA